jgi:DNA-binding beta-propeller fold protein YncE
MSSFLACHKKVNWFSPSRNPAELAPLAGLKKGGRLLPRPRSTRTKPSLLGLAQGRWRRREKSWLSVFSTLAIGFVWLTLPLRAQFAYVTNWGTSNNVSAYSIGANGALTPVPGSPFAAGRGPFSVAVDPTGKFAYVANLVDHNVSAYRIGTNGALTSVTGSPFAAGRAPHSVAVDPTGKFAYVANLIDNNVSAYRIGADGALTQLTTSPFAAGAGPFSVAVDPTGKFAYVANVGSHIGDSTVSAYSIGANGGLTPVTGSPIAAGVAPRSVAVDPTGKFAYVANLVDHNVSAYSIGTNGALTPVTGSPFAAERGPFSVAVDPTSKFAYVANSGDNNVSAYSIGTNGALTPVTGSPFAAERGPRSVAVDPTGKFAYVANSGDNNVSAYSIGAGGALTQLTTSPFAAGSSPTSVAITPFVPFASFFAKLTIVLDGFALEESFTLGANSNGINPVTENVTLQIGSFSVTIPPGSFNRSFKGYVFDGAQSIGVSLRVQIVPLGNKMFTFQADARPVHLTGITKPVTVVLTIGINSGTTTAVAGF